MKIEDSVGNESRTIEEFWDKELNETYIEMEKKFAQENERVLNYERVGSVANWYKIGNDYWQK